MHYLFSITCFYYHSLCVTFCNLPTSSISELTYRSGQLYHICSSRRQSTSVVSHIEQKKRTHGTILSYSIQLRLLFLLRLRRVVNFCILILIWSMVFTEYVVCRRDLFDAIWDLEQISRRCIANFIVVAGRKVT